MNLGCGKRWNAQWLSSSLGSSFSVSVRAEVMTKGETHREGGRHAIVYSLPYIGQGE